MNNRRCVLALATAVIGFVLAGPLANPATAQEKLKVILLPFSESLGAVIADKKGYFKEEGLEIEVSKMAGSALMIPVLQSGKVDIILSNTVSTLQAIDQGLDATLLAPSAVVRSAPPDSTTALIVLKGAYKSPKELEGKRIAVNVINSIAWLYMVALLDKHGVDRNKVRFVEVPFPQMNDPLLNKQIDAVGQVEPFRTILLNSGKVDAIGYSFVEVQPNADITQYLALTSWVKKNPQTAAKFARAVIKGSQFANSNPAETRQINVEYTGLNAALKDAVMLPRFGEKVNAAEVARTSELMVKYGMLKKPVDLSGRIMAQ